MFCGVLYSVESRVLCARVLTRPAVARSAWRWYRRPGEVTHPKIIMETVILPKLKSKVCPREGGWGLHNPHWGHPTGLLSLGFDFSSQLVLAVICEHQCRATVPRERPQICLRAGTQRDHTNGLSRFEFLPSSHPPAVPWLGIGAFS